MSLASSSISIVLHEHSGQLRRICEPGIVSRQNRLEIAIHDPQLCLKTAGSALP
jgi:hypothetical protein